MTTKNTVATRRPTLAEQTKQALQELASGLPGDVQETVARSFEHLLTSDKKPCCTNDW